MQNKEEYFGGVSIVKIAFIVGIILGFMVGFSGLLKGEDNKTIKKPDFRTAFPKILDDDSWSSQLIYDTIGGCYQGTIKWILLVNPSILGAPGPLAQRQMVEHCFCVMDKVRKAHPIKEYKEKVFDDYYIGNLFFQKAVECVREYDTLPSFFMKIPDNETKIEIPEDKPNDSQDEPPGLNQKESETGLPETIFQG